MILNNQLIVSMWWKVYSCQSKG